MSYNNYWNSNPSGTRQQSGFPYDIHVHVDAFFKRTHCGTETLDTHAKSPQQFWHIMRFHVPLLLVYINELKYVQTLSCGLINRIMYCTLQVYPLSHIHYEDLQ